MMKAVRLREPKKSDGRSFLSEELCEFFLSGNHGAVSFASLFEIK